MDLRVRFVERPLQEREMAPQTAAVRSDSSLRRATITNGGLAMLASIVGKRLPRYVKDHIGYALLDTMHGDFDDDGETEGDVLASVYGEILGPLFTCLERDGDFTIIRLVSSRDLRTQKKRADLLLLDRSSGLVMLQECKGHCSDYYSAAVALDEFDICRRLRERRNRGKRQQMMWPDPSQLGTRRVHISGIGGRVALPVPHAEQSVVVTAVPDGRTARRFFSPDPPDHENCKDSCKTCLFQGGPTLITVLSSEPVSNGKSLGTDGLSFLDWYRACERAVWGRAHGAFGQAFSSLLGAWRGTWTSLDMPHPDTPILAGLVEEAIEQKVFVDFPPIWSALEAIQLPQVLVSAMQELQDTQGEASRPELRSTNELQLSRILFGGDEDEGVSLENAIGNWRLNVGVPWKIQAEVNISMSISGLIELTMVPTGAGEKNAADLLVWGLSRILAGDDVPPDFIYASFENEVVEWANPEREETKQFSLGKSLRIPRFSPAPMAYSKRAIEELRRSDYGDLIADKIVKWHSGSNRPWPDSLFGLYCLQTYHANRRPRTLGRGGETIAYVTNDARAVLRIPYLSE